MTPAFWQGRRVFVTGHTGFKGAWLALWLHRLGAQVTGYALDPASSPNLFDAAAIGQDLAADHRADIRDLDRLRAALTAADPEIVLHLAAQSLVRRGYDDPLGTFGANLTGTVNLLEACRTAPSLLAAVIVTTDKVYENRATVHAYREDDQLGGADPYSASKACAEIATAAYARSFLHRPGSRVRVATARAGNVLGGGDWAEDRILPDCIRAFAAHQPVTLRNPGAIRPWQHVLDPLAGYLTLAEHLAATATETGFEAWNFGPDPGGEADVGTLACRAADLWGGDAVVEHGAADATRSESGILRVASTRARSLLGWRPRWDFTATMAATVGWYRAVADGTAARDATLADIAAFETAGQARPGA